MPARLASASCETPLRSRWRRTTSPKAWLSESFTPVKSGFADEMSTDGRRQAHFRNTPGARIAALILLGPELDAKYERVKADPYRWKAG
jgi:hypothetical protein